jgi:hypothetical protein
MGWNGISIIDRADYNTIIGNSFSADCKPIDLMNIYSASYNLIEGNYFGNASHTALAIHDRGSPAEYNIIRNNTFQNYLHNNLAVFMGPKHTLVEGNLIYDAGELCDENGCPQNTCGSDRDRSAQRSSHSGMQLTAEYSIIRNNVFVNNGKFGMQSWSEKKTAIGNHIYSNTFYSNYDGWNTESGSEYGYRDNKIVNNIFAYNIDNNIKVGPAITDVSNRFLGNRFFGDALVRYKHRTTVNNIQALYSNEWEHNAHISDDVPGFINIDKRNLKLRGDSNLIDKGRWLTTITTSSGRGNSFVVADPGFFSDGFGVMSGDRIQIQNQSSSIKVNSIDYRSGRITLDRSVSWNKGDGVSLPFKGNAPDIGAYEYESNSLMPPKLFIVQQ